MNTRKLVFTSLLLLFSAGLIFTACKKEEDDKDTEQASDYALSEKIFEDAGDIGDQALAGTLSMKSTDETSLFSNCATITRDTISIPHVVTVDFGPVNCLCNDGSYRRGQIIITYTGHYADSGYSRTVSFNDYYVNDNQVLGNRVVTNNGHNQQGNLNYSVVVNGQIILANSAGQITWNAERNREWIEGSNTPQRIDDVYLLTGSSTGTRLNGSTYTSVITTALRKELSCVYRHPVSGVVEITPDNKPVRTLDYGSGTCDNVGTVTINGVTYNIVLH
ncbi:MAG: hypothetical protein AB9842_09470 [Bacteroidales bacterium]